MAVRGFGERLEGIADAKKFVEKGKLEDEKLTSLTDGLKRIEGFAGEKYLTIIHVESVELVGGKAGDEPWATKANP